MTKCQVLDEGSGAAARDEGRHAQGRHLLDEPRREGSPDSRVHHRNSAEVAGELVDVVLADLAAQRVDRPQHVLARQLLEELVEEAEHRHVGHHDVR